jgi:hypothetical protein
MFDNEFLNSLDKSPAVAGKQIYDHFVAEVARLADAADTYEEYLECNYGGFLEALAVLQGFCAANEIEFSPPPLDAGPSSNAEQIVEAFTQMSNRLAKNFANGTSEHYRDLFEQKFDITRRYEFSDGDMARIQTLINELRDLIANTDELQEDHRARILKRLEKLQAELHKSVSDLDRFWGILSDGAVILEKVGESAKPIVDRIREIAEIVWRVQARAEELPSNIPLRLPSGEDDG